MKLAWIVPRALASLHVEQQEEFKHSYMIRCEEGASQHVHEPQTPKERKSHAAVVVGAHLIRAVNQAASLCHSVI